MFDLGDIRYNSWEKPCSEVQFMRRKKKKNHQNVWSVHEKDFFFVEQVKHADCRGGYIVFIQRFNVPIGSNWHLQPGAQQGQLWGESCLYLQFMKKKWQAENLICIQEKSFFFYPFFPFFLYTSQTCWLSFWCFSLILYRDKCANCYQLEHLTCRDTPKLHDTTHSEYANW